MSPRRPYAPSEPSPWRPRLRRAALILAACCALGALVVMHMRSNAQDADGGDRRGRLVYIGAANSVRLISFLDERGKLTGYDVEVLRAAQKYVRGYRFRFVPMEFTGLFAGIDTGKLDLIVCDFGANPDRERKYLLSDGYVRKDSYLTVRPDEHKIHSLDDLGGRTVEAWSAASSDYPAYRRYNQVHPENPIRILTSNGDPAVIVKNLLDRRTDAFATTPQTFTDLSTSLGVRLKQVGGPTSSGFAHFLIRKDDPDLKREIDRAIAMMAADGTLSRLSRKWWGGDYAPSAADDRRADEAKVKS